MTATKSRSAAPVEVPVPVPDPIPPESRKILKHACPECGMPIYMTERRRWLEPGHIVAHHICPEPGSRPASNPAPSTARHARARIAGVSANGGGTDEPLLVVTGATGLSWTELRALVGPQEYDRIYSLYVVSNIQRLAPNQLDALEHVAGGGRLSQPGAAIPALRQFLAEHPRSLKLMLEWIAEVRDGEGYSDAVRAKMPAINNDGITSQNGDVAHAQR